MLPCSAPTTDVQQLSASILELLLPHRRAADPEERVSPHDFPEQLRQIAGFVATDSPIVFALPGFPCKSPNSEKVLSHLPDEGERLALRFLEGLCEAIQDLYAPGAVMLICSDGHVFGDLIRVPDEHIDAYSDALRAMIAEEGMRRISTFDLRDVLGDLPHDEKRARIHDKYAPTVEQLRAEVRYDEDTLRLYRGITRFLFDDTADFEGTRSALQRECRRRAYGVIQRSRAWSTLIAEYHPRTVRLSIHPQRRGSEKLGIRLLSAPDAWTTPWHSSVVHYPDGSWELMRRADAEKIGEVVLRDGRPSHFEAAGRAGQL